MTSGGAGFLRYLTWRKAPFPRFGIFANGVLLKRRCWVIDNIW